MFKVKKCLILLVFLVMMQSMTSVILFAATQITADQAKAIAIDAVDQEDVGVITDVELENEGGILVYAVEFTKDGIEKLK